MPRAVQLALRIMVRGGAMVTVVGGMTNASHLLRFQAPAARKRPCALTKRSTPSAQNMTVVSTQPCLAGLVRLGLIPLLTTTATKAYEWKETTAATRQNTLGAFGATQLTLTRDGSSVLCPLAKVSSHKEEG